ncbi:MAG TPA: IniB N-terminal domain-containing protein [Mycobacterium sp.]|jgi:hypothetical protein
MISLIDFILNLFRDDHAAQAFVVNPEQALLDAGLPNVSAAQIQSVAATAVPSLALGNGDPVAGLQTALTNHYGWEPVIAPSPTWSPTWAPQTEFSPTTDLASHNDTSLLSPDQAAGANAQQGTFNLGFGDITLFGSKTTATDGGVAVSGHASGSIVTGDGAVLGNANSVNNGDIDSGYGSNVNVGQGNTTNQGNTAAGHDVVTNHDGSVIQTSHGTTSVDTTHTVVDTHNTTTSVADNSVHDSGNQFASGNHIASDNQSSANWDNSVHDNLASYNSVHDSSSTYAPTHVESTTVETHHNALFDAHHGF